MKILKTFVLGFVGVYLVFVLVGHGNELSRFRKADKAKHAGHGIVAAIEIYRASHKEPPPDLKFLKLDEDVIHGWGYTREGTGYELSCDVAGFLDWKSSSLVYARNEKSQIQGWVLTDDNGEWH